MLFRQIRQEQSKFPGSFNIIFNSSDKLQFLMKWGHLFHNRHVLKSTELIPIRVELVFMGPFLKLIFTCLSVKQDHMNSGVILLRELKTSNNLF